MSDLICLLILWAPFRCYGGTKIRLHDVGAHYGSSSSLHMWGGSMDVPCWFRNLNFLASPDWAVERLQNFSLDQGLIRFSWLNWMGEVLKDLIQKFWFKRGDDGSESSPCGEGNGDDLVAGWQAGEDEIGNREWAGRQVVRWREQAGRQR